MKTKFVGWASCMLFSMSAFAQQVALDNAYLSRSLELKPYLHTTAVENKETNQIVKLNRPDEFLLRLSEGTDKLDTDVVLSSKDFKVEGHKNYTTEDKEQGIKVSLVNKEYGLKVDVHYELAADKPYMRKYLNITSSKDGKTKTLERIDVDALYMEGAYQVYHRNSLTTWSPSNWRPALGQPVYNYQNATFWGVEFPAANNSVTNQYMQLGYMWGRELQTDATYTTHKSVMGVSDDAKYIDDAFFDYITDIRIRPLRFQLQYNTLFELGIGSGVNEKSFLALAKKVHDELTVKRGTRPINSYTVDDGWEDVDLKHFEKDGEVWATNERFTKDFEASRKMLKQMDGTLGLWFSPGSFFGAQPQVETLRKKGFEALSLSMSMTGPKYMEKLEERVLKLTRQGVGYFKFDGLFGHLNIRDFELNGRGVPTMPQLHTEGFKANDERLNNPMYDELKLYYLVAGTERLTDIMLKQHAINPDVYIAITNGAFLSPWWLQYVDAVWLINCGDSAEGVDRSEELVYRDGTYYDALITDNAKFPINAIWNHEPKKTSTGESKDTFRDYLFMHLSRGTGFVELYIKPSVLSDDDWDVLAEGIKWMENIMPAFERVKMIGGVPQRKEVYGYAGWGKDMGYVSMHNPSDEVCKFVVKMDRSIGVNKEVKNYTLSSPLQGNTEGLKSTWSYGDILTVELQPKEMRVLTFKK